jgi:imidazolonepropionase-like amidohydrolase
MPALLLGVEDRVGAIRPGFHADLVLWRGKPFSPTSRPSLVWIGGELAYVNENLMEEE